MFLCFVYEMSLTEFYANIHNSPAPVYTYSFLILRFDLLLPFFPLFICTPNCINVCVRLCIRCLHFYFCLLLLLLGSYKDACTHTRTHTFINALRWRLVDMIFGRIWYIVFTKFAREKMCQFSFICETKTIIRYTDISERRIPALYLKIK